MDDASREFIISNTKELIHLTEYRRLLRACEEERLLSGIMCARIENLTDSTEEEKHAALFLKITKRGPDAFDKLIAILTKLEYAGAVALLHRRKTENSTYISMHNKERTSIEEPVKETYSIRTSIPYVPDGCYPTKCDTYDSGLPLTPYTGEIKLDPPLNVIKSKEIQNNPKMPVYPMKSKDHRGVLLMVNIIEFPKTKMKKRLGADIDGKHLLYLFKELGFTCFEYVNLNSVEFFDILDRLCKSEYTALTESFVLILMSHGEMTKDMHDRVEFHDGSIVKLHDIENRFTNISCRNLVNKPKILMFPFCRGPTADIGIPRLQKDGYPYQSSHIWNNIPSKSDLIVCFATVSGFQTMRDTIEGSWYVQALCEVFAEYAHDTHLEDMLKIIGNKIKKLRSETGEMQTPAFNNHGFTKCLYFNPGIYEE